MLPAIVATAWSTCPTVQPEGGFNIGRSERTAPELLVLGRARQRAALADECVFDC